MPANRVSAIKNLLKGLDVSEKGRSSSLDLGVDPPSSIDPPFPLAVPASTSRTNCLLVDAPSVITKGNNRNGGLVLSDIITQIKASKDSAKVSYRSSVDHESFSALNSYTARRASEKLQVRGLVEENTELRDIRQFMNSHFDRQYLETPYKDAIRDSHNNHVPNFQRPLSRKNTAGRISASRRRSFDDSQLPLGDLSSYVDGPASLHDALSEGLNSTSDWKARIAAFNYLQSLLQQGPRGIQDITQSFEKVMKLFFQHLDDPHHKVAQAALSALADLIPVCRKPFESYVERILPHVFSRLIDSKELALKKHTPRIEVDLMNIVQSKTERQRSKSSYDPSDVLVPVRPIQMLKCYCSFACHRRREDSCNLYKLSDKACWEALPGGIDVSAAFILAFPV